MSNTIQLPELCLVALIGASGSGKTTFAQQHFRPGEVLSSDAFRLMVAGDENAQDASQDAFEALYAVASKRLARGLLTVIDATNVQPEARRVIVELAKAFDVLPAAVVLNLPPSLLLERHRQRSNRPFATQVITKQADQLRRSLGRLTKEGFRHITLLSSPDEVAAVNVERTPLYNNLKHLHGPFDFIGDVHGCLPELRELLHQLGYQLHESGTVTPPAGRTAVFVGDLVDRGPDSPGVLRLVMQMVQAGQALCVPGNHDVKLLRALQGRQVKVAHGLEQSLAQLATETPEFRAQVMDFIEGLVSHYLLDGGKVVVAHAGMLEAYQGRASKRVREFALYGETTGETDEFGLPVRGNWAARYTGKASVIYGHTPVVQAEWLNHTIDIDTGCVYGGQLTALRYPEGELISVAAQQVYCASGRPLPVPALSAQHTHDELLNVADFSGKRLIETRLRSRITIREDQAAAALETLGRFAADPRWLMYLPPTMSPSETSRQDGYLEYPTEAFEHYRKAGVERLICQEKHMGSRAVVIVTRSDQVAQTRFGISSAAQAGGVIYTRTGRHFFEDAGMEAELLARLRQALEGAGLWQELSTDWVALDTELLPWSLKAGELIRRQYAAVGAAASATLPAEVAVLAAAAARDLPVTELLARTRQRSEMAADYVRAYRQYVRRVSSLADLRLAPFHVLASQGAVHSQQNHLWHLNLLSRLAQADPALLIATAYQEVDLAEQASLQAAEDWWLRLTTQGGEGMVVKPLDYVTVTHNAKGLVQPAIKVRGREYLRIIYGPEYTAPANLERLRQRALGGKRALALREFALGLEGLERFVAREPLRRVHECVFGVLALESEPLDPRL